MEKQYRTIKKKEECISKERSENEGYKRVE
jgi:hypothetical protein